MPQWWADIIGSHSTLINDTWYSTPYKVTAIMKFLLYTYLIKIYHGCEGKIEKSVHRDHSLASLRKPRDARQWSSRRIFLSTLTSMIDSYELHERGLSKTTAFVLLTPVHDLHNCFSGRKYSRTSMTRTSLGPWKIVRYMGSSSHWGVAMAPGQEANGDNLGKSFWLSIE